MDYSKPKVIIDLDEYLHLTHKPIIPGTELNEEEYGAALHALVSTALQSPALFKGNIAEGINLITKIGKFKAYIGLVTSIDQKVGVIKIVKSE